MVITLSILLVVVQYVFGLSDFTSELLPLVFLVLVLFVYAITWLNAASLYFASRLIGNESFTLKEIYTVLGHFYVITLLYLIPYISLLVLIYWAVLEVKTIHVLGRAKIGPAIGTWALGLVFLTTVTVMLYVGLLTLAVGIPFIIDFIEYVHW